MSENYLEILTKLKNQKIKFDVLLFQLGGQNILTVRIEYIAKFMAFFYDPKEEKFIEVTLFQIQSSLNSSHTDQNSRRT